MNLSARLAELKRQQQAKHAKEGACSGKTIAPSTWVLVILLLLLVGLGALTAFEYLFRGRVPPELAGFWEVETGPQKGSTFEFFRNGTLEVHIKTNVKGKKKNLRHTEQVALKGKILQTISKDPQTGLEAISDTTIHELTAESLILEYDGGAILKLVRLE